MNKKYRLFGKLPVVDLLIVLVLMAVVAAGTFFLTRGEVKEQTGADAQAETYPFEAVLCVENLTQQDHDLVAVGDKLYLENGTYVATVTAKESKPFYKFGFDAQTGESVATKIDGRLDVYLTVKGEALSRGNKGILFGKKRIAYDNLIQLGNEKYFWKMMTVDITREEA